MGSIKRRSYKKNRHIRNFFKKVKGTRAKLEWKIESVSENIGGQNHFWVDWMERGHKEGASGICLEGMIICHKYLCYF